MRLPSAATGRCMAGDLPALQGMFQGASEGARQNGVLVCFFFCMSYVLMNICP